MSGSLAAAKRLVAASGTRGAPVVVWTRQSYRKYCAHVATALRRLGYRARLKVVEDSAYYDALKKAGPNKVQASYGGWFSDYPSAGAYITGLLSMYLEPTTGFSDPVVKRQIARAQQLQQTDVTTGP